MREVSSAFAEYLEISGLKNRPNAPLFPIALGKTRKLGNRPATRIDAARMLKRRLKDAGLSDAFSPHSFRATGITNFLENGGTLEVAQRIAGHADSRTTNSTTDVGRGSYSKTWSGFDTDFKTGQESTASIRETNVCHPFAPGNKGRWTSRSIFRVKVQISL